MPRPAITASRITSLELVAIALVTAALRLLPVMLLGKGGKPLPPAAVYLSRVMPPAIIGFK